LKLIVGSILVFSIVILFLFALFPSEVSVMRVVQIRNSKDSVFRKLTNLADWKSWNLFFIQPLTNGKIETPDEKSEKDFIFLNDVQVRKGMSGGDTLNTIWQHGGDSFVGQFNLKEMENQTIVQWTLRFHVKWYPWKKLSSMFYDKQLGPVMEKSLLNLQNQLEAH
jgi:hypothetical protein